MGPELLTVAAFTAALAAAVAGVLRLAIIAERRQEEPCPDCSN